MAKPWRYSDTGELEANQHEWSFKGNGSESSFLITRATGLGAGHEKHQRVERKWGWREFLVEGYWMSVHPQPHLWVCSSTSDCCFLPLHVAFSFSGHYHHWKCRVHSWPGHSSLFTQVHTVLLAPFIIMAEQKQSGLLHLPSVVGRLATKSDWVFSEFTNFISLKTPTN